MATPVSAVWDGTNLNLLGADGALLFSVSGTNRELVTKDLSGNLGAVKATSIATGTAGSETTITASAAEINAAAGTGIDSTELGLLNGATAGSITASKIVTRTAAQGIPLATLVVAATGANASNGAALTKDVNLVTGADNTTCVVLPVGVAGEAIVVENTVANKVLPVFPNGTENINGAGAGVVFTMGPARRASFVCTAAGVWYVKKDAAGTATVAEQNILTGVTATATELNYTDVTTAGVAQASKAVVLDAAAHVDAVKTTALSLGASGAATLVTATAAQLNTLAGASAGIASVLAGGLGASASYINTKADTTTLLTAHATKARAALVVVRVDETFANGNGAQSVFAVGETTTGFSCFVSAATLASAAEGAVFVKAGTNTTAKHVTVTGEAATGTGTGGVTVTVLGIPTT